jgi:hypothetical protein
MGEATMKQQDHVYVRFVGEDEADDAAGLPRKSADAAADALSGAQPARASRKSALKKPAKLPKSGLTQSRV